MEFFILIAVIAHLYLDLIKKTDNAELLCALSLFIVIGTLITGGWIVNAILWGIVFIFDLKRNDL